MTLEPCPFCGGSKIDVEVVHVDSFTLYSVACADCDAERASDESEKDAISSWNTRATDPRITELEQPCEPGAFAGDIWYGHPEKRTLGTHRWDGSAWQELPSEIEGCLSLLADARARIAALTAEVARKDEALRFAHSWLGYWATHIGNCRGGQVCTCGLTRVRYDARAALEARND